MRAYLKRVAGGIGMLFAIIAVGGLWLGLPTYVLINYCREFNWIAAVTLAWMIVFPIFLFSAMDDGEGHSVRFIPPEPPPPKPKPPDPPKRVGRMGGTQ